MSALDNVQQFFDGEVLSAEELDALRTALLNEFSSGISSTNIEWPLVAQGTLDMNNQSIINLGSLFNVIHVNAANSLASAISTVNAAGGGAIVIDPGFTATSTSLGLEVTANDVLILGYGQDSKISAVGTSYGLKISGSNCVIKDVEFIGTSDPAVVVTGNNVKIDANFVGSGGIQVGDSSVIAYHTNITSSYIYITGQNPVHFVNSIRARVTNNYLYSSNAGGRGIYVDPAATNFVDTTVVENMLYAEGGNGVGLSAELTAGSSSCRGLVFAGNNVRAGDYAVKITNMDRSVLTGNQLRAKVDIGGTTADPTENSIFENNWVSGDSYFYGLFNANVSGNSFEADVYLGYDGSSAQDGTHSLFNHNRVNGDLVVHTSGDPGFESIIGNDITGATSSLERLLEDGLVKQVIY